MYNLVSTLAPSFFIGSFFVFAVMEDSHKILDEFEFRPDSTTDCGVSRCVQLAGVFVYRNGSNYRNGLSEWT